MESRSRARGCFKFGCLGCLGLVVIGAIVVLALLLISVLSRPGEERVEEVRREQPVRAPDRVVGPPDATVPRVEGRPGAVEVAEPGRVVLDVSQGRFAIRPGPAGEPIRLEGRYDDATYELEESYETYGETGWIYRLSFGRRGLAFMITDDTPNRLELVVPKDAPFVLEGNIGIGESELELGGLWLLDVDLELGIGEHELSFDEPLLVPMERLRLDASIGELRVLSVGNASPRSVEVRRGIGVLELDLEGAWSRDAEILASCGIGECRVRVPDDVGIELENASVLLGESDASELRGLPAVIEGRPTLRLSVSGKLGEVRIER